MAVALVVDTLEADTNSLYFKTAVIKFTVLEKKL